MARRAGEVSTVSCPLTLREREVVDEMRRMTGLKSDGDAQRLAFWHLAKHLNLQIDSAIFALRWSRKTVRRG